MFNTFIPVYNFDMDTSDQTGITLTSYSTTSKFDCFTKCNMRADCVMISFKANQCMLFNQVKYSLSSTSVYLYEKFTPDFSSITASMTNHWPFNSNLNDIISSANLIQPVNIAFTTDRLGSSASALYINGGSLTIPSGTFISGDFTVSAWVKVHALTNSDARLFELNDASQLDSITFLLSSGSTGKPALSYSNTGSSSASIQSDIALDLNTWHHVAFTLQSTTASLYVDGVQRVQQVMSVAPRGVSRTDNMLGVGVSNASVTNAYAEFDDLKIFNRSLTSSEVVMVTNSYAADNSLANILLSLANQWTFNTNIVDSITSVSLYNPVNVIFTTDRSGSVNSALYLKSGYLTIQASSIIITARYGHTISM